MDGHCAVISTAVVDESQVRGMLSSQTQIRRESLNIIFNQRTVAGAAGIAKRQGRTRRLRDKVLENSRFVPKNYP